MKKIYLFFSIISIAILAFSYMGCTKVVRTALLKGQWQIDNFTINGGSENMVEAFFADHKRGKGKMIMSFSNSGVMKAEHYSFNEIDSTIFGTWSQIDESTQTLKLGTLLEGTFNMELLGLEKAIMYTDSNFISFYDIGNVSSVIEVSKVTE